MGRHEGHRANGRAMFDGDPVATFNHVYGYGKNPSYDGTHANPSILAGYDEDRTITDVTFDNLVINGELNHAETVMVSHVGFPSLYANEHGYNLMFGRYANGGMQ
ncbi:hypothetical protein [Plantactinospora sp. KLBMP9567]|uniref:hypothetical protein n=1 Tax=Plantactinospora sp. KLBMP9567 TaxID=3085900 RepID=UPI002980FE33|nr:hypothetical protein [Plantactinospora sp. KLBMP9567]MDW5330265.1 hypothetical protein [Plantactinospora sp. KLBMP9567]